MVKVVPAPSGEGPPVVVVRFSEWPKVQETRRTQVVALTEVPDDEGATEREGCCELCGRQMKLTFHHLLPKETHARYPSKVDPVPVPRLAPRLRLRRRRRLRRRLRLSAPPLGAPERFGPLMTPPHSADDFQRQARAT